MDLSTCTLEERVGRWEDQRDIKNLMGIYVNHIIMNMDAQIFDALWSGRDDVCYGDNDGWYVGPAAVRGYYDAVHARNALVAELLQKKFPEEIGHRTAEENFGIGTFRDFPVACPVIEVAGDGQTANDVDARCGTDWGQPAQPLPELPEFAPLKDFAMPAYSVARPNRVQYSGRRPLTGSPEIPEPYRTFADTFSYGV